jgi:hypothetical protein
MTVDEPDNAADARQAGGSDWLEVEDIDPDTGELLGTRWQRIGADGAPIDDPFYAGLRLTPDRRVRLVDRQPRRLRIGVVVPLTSLPDLATLLASWLTDLRRFRQRSCVG